MCGEKESVRVGTPVDDVNARTGWKNLGAIKAVKEKTPTSTAKLENPVGHVFKLRSI